MITEIKVGDYIEKSELDTEQKYNDVVEVFEQWGFPPYLNHDLNKAAFCCLGNSKGLGLVVVCKNTELDYSDAHSDAHRKRKLTYNDIIQLKKVDVDNCNVDKLVSNRVSTVNRDLEGQMTSRATNNKYERMVEDRYGDSCHVDVYDVLKAFEVTCPAIQHAIKKLLCTGLRGHKDRDTDLLEAKESIVRAIELNGEVK